MRRLRRNTAQLLDIEQGDATSGMFVDWFLQGLIVLNVFAIIMGSVSQFHVRFEQALLGFEVFSVVIFTIEYLARVWSCVDLSSGEYRGALKGRIRYMLSAMALVDLVAILPFYLSFYFSIDLRFLRAVRLLRVLKLTRYWSAFGVLAAVVKNEMRAIAAALFVLLLLLVLVSSGIYVIEEQAQPDAFGSIPAAMWWAIATLTTVGYGDVTPITPLGKFFGAMVTVIGIGMAALPTAILASGFTDEIHRRKETFGESVKEALADGSMSHEEEEQLDELRESLGLSASDATQMLKASLRSSLGMESDDVDRLLRLIGSSSDMTKAICPKCDHRFTAGK